MIVPGILGFTEATKQEIRIPKKRTKQFKRSSKLKSLLPITVWIFPPRSVLISRSPFWNLPTPKRKKTDVSVSVSVNENKNKNETKVNLAAWRKKNSLRPREKVRKLVSIIRQLKQKQNEKKTRTYLSSWNPTETKEKRNGVKMKMK